MSDNAALSSRVFPRRVVPVVIVLGPEMMNGRGKCLCLCVCVSLCSSVWQPRPRAAIHRTKTDGVIPLADTRTSAPGANQNRRASAGRYTYINFFMSWEEGVTNQSGQG